MSHPFTKYAEALVRVENELSKDDLITARLLQLEIEKGLDSFRLSPSGVFEGKEKVKYEYTREAKGDTKSGIFLSPNIISSDKQAKNIYAEADQIVTGLSNKDLNKLDYVKMSIAPTSGEFLSFSLANSIGRGKPKATLKEIALNAIASLTTEKPTLQYRIEKKGGPEIANTCLIPDLSLEELIEFIMLFKRLKLSKTASELMIGDVRQSKTGAYEPKRPLIYRGNFPNPPRSSALSSVALLGAIGEFAKEAEVSKLALQVMESLKGATMYMIKYGGASTYTYNHHVVELAKGGKLGAIVNGIYYTQLYNEGRRTSQSNEYQKFDLFSSRFLQQFTRSTFKDFLALRAEYPTKLRKNYPTYMEVLLSTYFKKMEMIDPEIVSSARILGKWLNQVAYFAAKGEVKNGSPNYWEELRRAKSKVLIELESTTFSAKSGDALIAQAITRAGRISGMDAPEAAALFMEKTSSGELKIDNAKNLLIAFSRLKNKVEIEEQTKDEQSEDDTEQTSESEDLSND